MSSGWFELCIPATSGVESPGTEMTVAPTMRIVSCWGARNMKVTACTCVVIVANAAPVESDPTISRAEGVDNSATATIATTTTTMVDAMAPVVRRNHVWSENRVVMP